MGSFAVRIVSASDGSSSRWRLDSWSCDKSQRLGLWLGCQELFPKARRISYLEWWFRNDSETMTLIQTTLVGLLPKVSSQAPAAEFEPCSRVEWGPSHCHATSWQRSQLQSLQERCDVSHEGVDTDLFVMNRPGGLRIVWDSLMPQEEWNRCGVSRVHLGYLHHESLLKSGSHYRWWWPHGLWIEDAWRKFWALGTEGAYSLDGAWIGSFRGHLPMQSYARFSRAVMSCYLTRPFVASWSLLDAMASGCCLVASDLDWSEKSQTLEPPPGSTVTTDLVGALKEHSAHLRQAWCWWHPSTSSLELEPSSVPAALAGSVGDLTHKTTALPPQPWVLVLCRVIWGSALLLNFMAYYGIPSAGQGSLLQLATTRSLLPTSAEPRHSPKRVRRWWQRHH